MIYVALLRALNVGGQGLMPMTELRALCAGLGLRNVRTYIQSGNVVFESEMKEPALQALLLHALHAKMDKPVGVLIRSASEMRAVLDANPFPDAEPAKVGVLFLQAPAPDIANLATPGREELRSAGREVFIHYPDGMGRSRLKLPAAMAQGTTRNLNTVRRLVAIADQTGDAE